MYIEVLDYAHEEYQFGSLNDFFCFFFVTALNEFQGSTLMNNECNYRK